MPLCGVVSAFVPPLVVLEHLLASKRADGRDLGILATELVRVVEYWVHVESRVGRFAAQNAQFVDESLLKGIGQVVLGTEEDNATL